MDDADIAAIVAELAPSSIDVTDSAVSPEPGEPEVFDEPEEDETEDK